MLYPCGSGTVNEDKATRRRLGACLSRLGLGDHSAIPKPSRQGVLLSIRLHRTPNKLSLAQLALASTCQHTVAWFSLDVPE
jgi:hypothetical protein